MNRPDTLRALAAFNAFLREQEEALDADDPELLNEALRGPRPVNDGDLEGVSAEEITGLLERSQALELRLRTLRNRTLRALNSGTEEAAALRSYARADAPEEPAHDLDLKL